MRVRITLATLALALTLAPLTAPLLAGSHPLAALLIRNFFSQLCHQDPSRSFLLAGAPVAVCVRCLGVYWGVAVGALVRMRMRGKQCSLLILHNPEQIHYIGRDHRIAEENAQPPGRKELHRRP